MKYNGGKCNFNQEHRLYPIKKDSRFCLAKSQNQARIENLLKKCSNFKQDVIISKIKISISNKICESKIQNLNYKQDSRMTTFLDLAATESKMHLQNPNLL